MSLESRRQTALDLSESGGFAYREIETTTFTIATYRRTDFSGEITVYIEGDGFAYVTPTRISSDPTPLNPTGLELATLDTGGNVIYLARPCQYVDLGKERFCYKRYWSSHRFSKEIISTYDQVLDKIKTTTGARSFHLVGYSGGGAVAVLIAAGRGDVISVRTVAAYLDHVALNEERGVAALEGSLDPMKVAKSLRRIPQIHYAGANDNVIPPWVVKNFALAVDDPRCARFVMLNGVGHQYGWNREWNRVGHIKPTC